MGKELRSLECIMERQKKLQDLCIQPGCEEGVIHVEHNTWRGQVR